MECITQCTRCGAKWEGDFEYCLTCDPEPAKVERWAYERALSEAQDAASDNRAEEEAEYGE